MKIKKLYDKLIHNIQVLPSGCWLWQGAIGKTGYGNTFWSGKYLNTHRAMFLAINGQLPECCICHRCDNKLCINPKHLFKASQKENLEDMRTKHRHSHGISHSGFIKTGWTPEKRAMRAKQTKNRMKMIHDLLTEKAGVPSDWKYCPKCAEWYPRVDFHKNAARHDGLKVYCKHCERHPRKT